MAKQQEIFSPADLKKGGQWLREKKVHLLQFAQGTYQFEVKDSLKRESYFPFLQVKDDGSLIDCICTCSIVEKKPYCPHLAAAYLKIFQNEEPLHLRFEKSLWNQLCFLAGSRHSFAPESLEPVSGGGWETLSQTGRVLFCVTPRNQQGKKLLKEIVNKKSLETEQTSLKFSNLSPEDISLWKQGRPSQFLLYRLSFWSDLASWLFLSQDEKVRYRIHFLEQKEALPKGIKVTFPALEATFYLSSGNWAQIIPSLKSVESPLKIYESQYPPIGAIRYDANKQVLLLEHEPQAKAKAKANKRKAPPKLKKKPQSVIEVEDWFYLPGKGFFPLSLDPALGREVLEKEEIGNFIDTHPELMAEKLHKITLDFTRHPVNYKLSFVAEPRKGLHLCAYLFTPGDLEQPQVARFGDWLYIPKHGFLRTQNFLFPGVTKLISLDSLTSFIERHRLWLNHFEGFQIHQATVESSLHFYLDVENALHFEMQVEEGLEAEGFVDLGEWIYVPTHGFYPKTKSQGFLRPGLVIPADNLAHFIQQNRDELQSLKGFFSSQCPLAAAGLVIFYDSKERIVVKPYYQLAPSYSMAQVHLLGEVTYVEGEGFFELPMQLVIPEDYRQKKIIPVSEEEYFITFELEYLRGYCIDIDDRLVEPRRLRLCMRDLRLSTRHGIWQIELVYTSEFGEVPLKAVLDAYQEEKTYICTKAGLLHLHRLHFSWLKELDKVPSADGSLALSSLDCLKLLAFEETVDSNGDPLTVEAWYRLTDTLLGKQECSLEGLKSSLRPYQQFGVHWLWQLYMRGLSGLLCDEMGLGKTHQAIALIVAIYNHKKSLRKNPILVVCPTSVIFHWEEILERFLPKLKVVVYYGIGRNLKELKERADIVLTSYGILRSEKRLIEETVFSLAVFDEIQAAKNPSSQTHQVLKQITADMRLGLTGTPIENNLAELKALFDVVLPGYLPTEENFKLFLSNTVESAQDAVRRALLQRLIHPFILRRKKKEVLIELPEKTEEIAHCLLKHEQKLLYNSYLKKEGAQVVQELQDETKPISYMHIFAILTRLKQVCDHPCLILDNVQDPFAHESGKWDLFVELLEEARESRQKVVVFSQFLKMLDIIEAYLDKNGIGHAGIRGSTRDRQQQVARFREDPHCEVFVASLQAAGVGIDLVAASVVIHYDRWWNPAKENQATDRVHRMGQNRGVQVFKLVTKETIEESINLMINRKMALLQNLVGYDDQAQLKSLDRSELIELLKTTRS